MEQGDEFSALLRQSAFFEHLLDLLIRAKIVDSLDRALEKNEVDDGLGFGHTQRIRMAHLLGVVDKGQRDSLLKMASERNEIAHNPWYRFEGDQERVSKTVRDVIDVLEAFISSR